VVDLAIVDFPLEVELFKGLLKPVSPRNEHESATHPNAERRRRVLKSLRSAAPQYQRAVAYHEWA
jgi:hypothetical protein